MTSLELRKINNYPEWDTEAGINSVIQFIQNQQLPNGLNARQQRRFQEKFGNGNWVVENIENERFLFYNPPILDEERQITNENRRIKLQVVRPNEHNQKLREVYDDSGSGVGINLFYAKVAMKYLGIKRTETTDFLKKQGNYQLTHNYQKVVNSPILARHPNERWGADLIFLDKYGFELNRRDGIKQTTNLNIAPAQGNNNYNNNNRVYRYALVVVDFFSKKIWAKALRFKDATQVRTAFDLICNESRTRPRILQVDNGSEFNTMPNYCRENNIRLVYTTTYTPTSNGLVERLNYELRKRIKAGLVKHNTLEWVNHLPEYLTSINNSKSSTTGFTPNELWSPGYRPTRRDQLINFNLRPNDNSSKEDIIKYVEARLYRNAKNQLDRQRAPNQFFVNDKVRLKISALKDLLGTEYRKRIKNGKEVKYNAINYTTTIYKVASIIEPTYERGMRMRQNVNIPFIVRNQQYILRNNNNNQLYGANGGYKFYGSDLLLVPSNVEVRNNENERPLNRYPLLQPSQPTLNPNNMQRTRYINRFRDIGGDAGENP